MPVRAFVEVLGNIGPDRMADLSRRGIVSDWYVYAGPNDYPGNLPRWLGAQTMVAQAGGRMWAWYWCDADQERTVSVIRERHERLAPSGYLLNIEKPLEEVPLVTLIDGVQALDRPIVASLSGTLPAVAYDWRTLDLRGVAVEWQAYLDSGEGPPPSVAVIELARVSRVLVGRRYRAEIDGAIGWGELADPGEFVSYKTRGRYRLETEQTSLWPPYRVVDRILYGKEWEAKGRLLGLADYSKIRVTLDTTRTAQAQRDLAGWEALAASARLWGASKRGVSVYLAEVTPDDVFEAIARGAA